MAKQNYPIIVGTGVRGLSDIIKLPSPSAVAAASPEVRGFKVVNFSAPKHVRQPRKIKNKADYSAFALQKNQPCF